MTYSPIVCCMLGAVSVQLYQIIDAARRPGARKPNFGSIEFYTTFLAMVLLSAIVGYIYFDPDDGHARIVHFHTGASAPLLMKNLPQALPAVTKRKFAD